jgi:translation elongation factor EF-G
VISKVCEEDPTLKFATDPETGQKILEGMGELHLQIVFERIEREFGLKIRAGKPRVMTRETIGRSATAETMVDRRLPIDENKESCSRRAHAPTSRRSSATRASRSRPSRSSSAAARCSTRRSTKR